MVNSPLIRPYFLGVNVALGKSPIRFPCSSACFSKVGFCKIYHDFIFNVFFDGRVFGWTFQRFLATLGWCKRCLIHNSKSQSPSCALGNNPKLLRIGSMYGIFTFIYHTNQPFIDRKTNKKIKIPVWVPWDLSRENFLWILHDK